MPIYTWISELEEYNYTFQSLPGRLNTKADALLRMTLLPPNNDSYEDIFEEKLYAVNVYDKSFKAQLISKQDNDPVIGPAKRSVANGEAIKVGRLKRVTNQLRIEDNLLVKSGRPVLPASLRRYLVSKFHETSHSGTGKNACID